jgi:hypothetical protein
VQDLIIKANGVPAPARCSNSMKVRGLPREGVAGQSQAADFKGGGQQISRQSVLCDWYEVGVVVPAR